MVRRHKHGHNPDDPVVGKEVNMEKTRRALDWLFSCLIRLPIIALALGILGIIIFVLLLAFNPEAASAVIQFFKTI